MSVGRLTDFLARSFQAPRRQANNRDGRLIRSEVSRRMEALCSSLKFLLVYWASRIAEDILLRRVVLSEKMRGTETRSRPRRLPFSNQRLRIFSSLFSRIQEEVSSVPLPQASKALQSMALKDSGSGLALSYFWNSFAKSIKADLKSLYSSAV